MFFENAIYFISDISYGDPSNYHKQLCVLQKRDHFDFWAPFPTNATKDNIPHDCYNKYVFLQVARALVVGIVGGVVIERWRCLNIELV